MYQRLLLLCLFVGLFCTANAQSDLVITEINYNNPGTDSLEFLELYNNGSSAIDLEGYTFTAGINYTFPAMMLPAGEFLILASDAGAVGRFLGATAVEWNSGSLSNGGELVQLEDGAGNVMDSVRYDDVSPWPDEADGIGSSLELCDVNSDNGLAASWSPSFNDSGASIFDVSILVSPGTVASCINGPYIRFLNSETTVEETAGTFTIPVILKRGSEVVVADASINNTVSTATSGDDYVLNTSSLSFTGANADDTLMYTITIVDDTDQEPVEIAGLDLSISSSTITRVYPNANLYTINITDNDRPLTRDLIITGVFDSHPSASGAKGVELYALADIADLSAFGIGSANNGGGSDGEEFRFPSVSITAGTCIYVADNADLFNTFFGFMPDYETGAMSINGDDAIELFESNRVIDVFGDIDVDGNGTPWEYLDGWAYRRSGTLGDSTVFNLSHWQFSGVEALRDVATNSAATNPLPICRYSTVAPTDLIARDDVADTEFNTAVNISILSNDDLPSGFTSLRLLTPPRGSATIVMNDQVRYTPELDACGSDSFTYEVCDANTCDTAKVTVNTACPPTFPRYDIDLVTNDSDGNGIADSVTTTCELKGIVYGVNLRGSQDGVQFTLIDATGGIAVFDFDITYYDVTEGDEITTRGTIADFNGLAQIRPDTIIFNSANNTLVNPAVVTALGESTESELIKIENLEIVDATEWSNGGTGFNARFANANQDTFIIRIDNDVNLFGTPAPTGMVHITGIGGQFGDDYQLAPRYMPDIDEVNSVIDPTLADQVRFFPNPANNAIWVESQIDLDYVRIDNLLGQEVLRVAKPDESERISLSGLATGAYLITFMSEGRSWTARLMVQQQR